MADEKKNHDLCPKCGAEIEDWGDREVFDTSVTFDFTCDGCGFEGKQVFDMVFTGFEDSEGNDMSKVLD